MELVTAYGISKFLEVSFANTHILTSGMEFGRKSTLLRNLIYRSSHPDKKTSINLIGKLQNESLRNIFAHSFVLSGTRTVSFVERTRGGDYAATIHTFTLDEFRERHMSKFAADGLAFQESLGLNQAELHEFAIAALSANTKSTKSPVPPRERQRDRSERASLGKPLPRYPNPLGGDRLVARP